MKKINEMKVSDCLGTTITMKFAEEVNMDKCYEVIKAAYESIVDYESEWIKEFGECCFGKKGYVEHGIWCDVFTQFVPKMVKAVAEEFPKVPFNGYAIHDDMKCLWIDDFDYSYDGSNLNIKETFIDEDCGYFCPECGLLVACANEELDADESIECDDCEKEIKVADLKYVPPTITEETIHIR